MENADALDLSKENIQPLKRGRNTAQLGLALQAQTDSSLHQMLSKKQEWYEMQIRTYEGSDPLELWCEYISWVEQSFPKHGPEGNLSVLLTKCFQAFKDEEKYKNDRRFVGLWIKYIEMQNDAKRVELYHLLHTQGIGVKCAEFYRSWAYEYQSVGDWKQADQIFTKGSMLMAQPAEELHAAHQQFLSSFVFNHKNMNNETSEDEIGNHPQGDHRMPMAALKAIGKKGVAPTVRVGSNVKSQLPGVVPAVQGSSGRSVPSSRTFGVRGNNAGPVTVYQEHGEPEGEVLHSQNVPTALPITQTINKENVVKAGPWTGQGLGSRKHHVSNAGNSFLPKQPGFEVHKDEEDASSGNDLRTHGIVVPNALQPRKGLEDGFHDAIAIFEEPNPFTKPMYPKNEVYAGGKELQLEELRAFHYFKKRAEQNQKLREMSAHHEQVPLYERKFVASTVPSVSLGMVPENHFISGEKPAPFFGDGQRLETMSENSFRQPGPSPSPANIITSVQSDYQQSQPQTLCGTPNSGAHSSGHIPRHEPPHMGHRFPSSNQSMHNQSMTLHTKLAMNEVQDLWGSPTTVKASNSGPNSAPSSNPPIYQPAFQIMKDDSSPHQAHANSLLRGVEPAFSHNHQTAGAGPHSLGNAHQHSVTASSSFPNQADMFEDPMTGTSYMPQQNGFAVYQESSYISTDPPVPRKKFQVFCDGGDAENNIPSHPTALECGNVSMSAHTFTSIEKVAQEKENLQKYPQADIELMEECGVAPVPNTSGNDMQHHANHFHVAPPAYTSHSQNHTSVYSDQRPHVQGPAAVMVSPEPMMMAPSGAQGPIPIKSLSQHNVMDSAPSTSFMYNNHTALYNELQHPASHCSAQVPLTTPEKMEDDATVAAAPQFGANMSESGITEAFFFPKMSAASTPFQVSPKKSRVSKNAIDFNSSLYRVEQSWPEDDGADGSNQSSDSPKTVPPLKLFRIKNEKDQLSAILESSKEKYQSMLSTGSRNSLSTSTSSKYGKYTTQRQSVGPQPYLNQIEESTEHSSSQEGQAQSLTQVEMQVQVPSQAEASQPQAQPPSQPQAQPPPSHMHQTFK
ncbi:Mitotic checkpoint serine/threonine-protein kinase BUB1 beta [Frankliniella fusca]|uniref:Mitotic checkpoint serine/threonine-protein kinase BUB1 beta n=1 Tax=Frankliniella fusca TaxID=407009 RepID=A0AAE1HIL2_9NEOP|nr:Mitotic checkpoint serine/threonine-protein kinase BUB1 beta [Frankliniella fusca]